jgi:hypothetical protein
VDQLRREGRDVTFESIRDAIRSLHGISISANTIKRNELAYEIYLSNRRKPRAGRLPHPSLRALLEGCPPEKRHALKVKLSRLRREPKDALIVRLVALESTISGQRDAENRLREEILRLSVRP